MEGLFKRPASVLAAFTIVILGVGLWAARAPNSVTGKLPFVGDFPIEMNAVYFVIFGPIVAMICAAGIWMVIANQARSDGHQCCSRIGATRGRL
jgi:hypothetical protein